MSIATIIAKGKAFEKRVAATVVESALAVAEEIWNTFGDECTTENAEAIAKGIAGDNAPAARKSEWKAFATSVQFGMAEALRYYPKTGDTLTRVKMFALAREIIKAGWGDYKAVVDTFVKNLDKKPSKGAGRTLASIVKSLFTVQTRKRNEIAFRKELAALCAKHGIQY